MNALGRGAQDEILVTTIHTINYFEFPRNYRFEGESHDFWELMYVDKGRLRVDNGTGEHVLDQGGLIFQKPNDFHKMRALDNAAPNLIVISFESPSPAVRLLEDKRLQVSEAEKNLLVVIIREAQKNFYYGSNDSYIQGLVRKPEAPFGSEQVVRIGLERFLIEVLRREMGATGAARTPPAASLRDTKDRLEVEDIIRYLEENSHRKLTLEMICKDLFLSRSYIQSIFKKYTDTSIIDYHGRLRVERAKELIRGGQHNFTQISEQLEFSSIYHFSRKFKETTGMTPSEYAQTVLGML